MTPTSEERREVAERLRKAADSDEWLDLTIENAIFGVFGEVRRPAADTLADLIEPPEITEDTSDGYHTTGELVRCGECIHFERCPMRKGDGSGYCWQARRRETRHGEDD